MDLVLAVLGGLAATAGLFGLIRYAKRQTELRRAKWLEAARQLSLELVSDEKMEGRRGDVELTVDVFAQTTSTGKTATVVYYTRFNTRSDAIPLRIEISNEGLGTKLSKLLGGGDVEVGDEDFDRSTRVAGDEADLLAVLGQSTRERIDHLRMELPEFEVKDGELEAKVRDRISDPARLVSLTEEVLAIAESLRLDPTKTAERIVANARVEQIPRVRRRMLETVLARFPDSPAARDAIDLAIAGDDPELAVTAARQLGGAEGARHLTRIADQLLARIEEARDSPPPVRRALARAIRSDAVLEPERAEAVLLALLSSDDVSARVEAARALKTRGTIRAVQPLLDAGKGLLTNGELKDAAKDAVAAIQARAEGAVAGGLSLAESEDERGRLSLEQQRRAAGALSVSAGGGGVKKG